MEDISEEEIHKHEESTRKDKRKVENCPEKDLLHPKKLKGSDSKDKKENVSPTIDVQSSDFKDFEFKDDNFDLPMDVKTKYRALCYSLKMLPHDNVSVSEMLHRDFIRGTIILIIDIIDQIKASRIALASLDKFIFWKTVLEDLTAWGMNVSFLLPRIDSLKKHLIDYQAIKDKGTRLSSEIEVQKQFHLKKLEEIKLSEGLLATLEDEFADILPTKAKLNSEFSKDANKGWGSKIVYEQENVSPTIDVQSSDFKDFEFKDDNFDLPMDVKTKYRALCYSLKMLPHDNVSVSEMLHRDFIRGTIILIIDIIDQIKASRIALASLDKFIFWKTMLEALAALGMNVGFLLHRIDSLMKHLIDYQANKDKGTRLSSEIEVQKQFYRKKSEEIKPIEGLIATLVDEFVDILPTKAKLNSEFSKDANKGWDSRIV